MTDKTTGHIGHSPDFKSEKRETAGMNEVMDAFEEKKKREKAELALLKAEVERLTEESEMQRDVIEDLDQTRQAKYATEAMKLMKQDQERAERLEAEVKRQKEEIAVSEKLLTERDRILDAFPCPDHGRCVPHVLDTATRLKQDVDRLTAGWDEARLLLGEAITKGKRLEKERDGLKKQNDQLETKIESMRIKSDSYLSERDEAMEERDGTREHVARVHERQQATDEAYLESGQSLLADAREVARLLEGLRGSIERIVFEDTFTHDKHEGCEANDCAVTEAKERAEKAEAFKVAHPELWPKKDSPTSEDVTGSEASKP